MTQEAAFHPLHRADGSATYASRLITVLAAVNGPVEVTRRDEIPDAAAIEVNVRPSSGVGGPRERWLESLIAATLRSVVLVHLHPRTLVQVTLQITKDSGSESGGVQMRKGLRDIALLPGLVNAAFAALTDSALPLEQSVVAGLAAVGADGEMYVEPTEKHIAAARSVHVMAFTLVGEEQKLLLSESGGTFTMEEWAEVEKVLKQGAGAALHGEDNQMEGDQAGDDQGAPWLKKAMLESVKKGEAWRSSG